jgi:hypothetical protein
LITESKIEEINQCSMHLMSQVGLYKQERCQEFKLKENLREKLRKLKFVSMILSALN